MELAKNHSRDADEVSKQSEKGDSPASFQGGLVNAFNNTDWKKSFPPKLSPEQLQLASTPARDGLGLQELLLVNETAEVKKREIPQIKNEESRLPQVGLVIGATAIAMFLTRNAHGAIMLGGTSGGAVIGGGLAYCYDRYLDSKRPAKTLTPSTEDLHKKLKEKE